MVTFKIYHLMFVKVDNYFQMRTLNLLTLEVKEMFMPIGVICIKRIYLVIKFCYHH